MRTVAYEADGLALEVEVSVAVAAVRALGDYDNAATRDGVYRCLDCLLGPIGCGALAVLAAPGIAAAVSIDKNRGRSSNCSGCRYATEQDQHDCRSDPLTEHNDAF